MHHSPTSGARATVPTITSRQHPLCKLVRSLHGAKGRRKHGLFIAEGGNAVTAALRARWPLKRLLVTPDDLEAGWGDVARDTQLDMQPVSAEIMEYLSEAQTSPGVIALAALPQAQASESSNSISTISDLLLVLDGVGDPGNVGTLIRSADASGAGRIALTPNSVDVFAPKAVRASAGSLFHLPPPLQDTAEGLSRTLQQHDVPLIVAVAHGGQSCFEYSWPTRCALVLGHETRGISPVLEDAATAHVTIPIFGRAESLNVAAAGAVLLYAWRCKAAR
jgi:TrmH family RNA methyltransferase